MKGILDGMFGWFNRLRTMLSQKQLINELGQFVTMVADYSSDDDWKLPESLPPLCVICWPPPKQEFEAKLNRFVGKSLLASINQCHLWSFTTSDYRFKTMCAKAE